MKLYGALRIGLSAWYLHRPVSQLFYNGSRSKPKLVLISGSAQVGRTSAVDINSEATYLSDLSLQIDLTVHVALVPQFSHLSIPVALPCPPTRTGPHCSVAQHGDMSSPNLLPYGPTSYKHSFR